MPQIEIHSVLNFDTNTVVYDIGSTHPSLSELTAILYVPTYQNFQQMLVSKISV